MNAQARPIDSEQAQLPLAMHELIIEQLHGSAVAAFAGRRVEQIIHYGHRPEDDLELPIDRLVREAAGRLQAYLDIVGHGRTTVPPERREQLLRYIEKAGGMLIAAYERLAVAEVAGFEPEEE